MPFFSSFSIEKPYALLAALCVALPILFFSSKLKKISKMVALANNSKLRIKLMLRTLFRCVAWVFAVLAFSKISFGTKKIPVHKSGSSVAFVFDISYSMMAQDGEGGLSRLDSAKIYAKKLLEKISGVSVSALIAKGDGIELIPETEDTSSIETMIENLSPRLMTSAGSSLGKGIIAALNAIPEYSPKTQRIWVFTDGDETDNLLEKALEKALSRSVCVTFVGFGSEKDSEVLAGDGITKVRTALRSKKLQEICDATNEKASLMSFYGKNLPASYLKASSPSSAWKLLKELSAEKEGDSEKLMDYEIHNVNRHNFFILMAVIFFIISFVAGEFTTKKFRSPRNTKSLLVSMAFLASIFMTSCDSEKKQVLDGVWKWYEGKYNGATAEFMNVLESSDKDSGAKQYALYNLGTTYLSMGECEAAWERISQVALESPRTDSLLRGAAFYNEGIIKLRKTDYKAAAECFKKAVIADPKNFNAKLNLELCNREIVQKQAQKAQSEMQGVNEQKKNSPDMKDEIFNLIREQENKKWKNMSDGEEKEKDVIDY